jgi:hypothetical protein
MNNKESFSGVLSFYFPPIVHREEQIYIEASTSAFKAIDKKKHNQTNTKNEKKNNKTNLPHL